MPERKRFFLIEVFPYLNKILLKIASFSRLTRQIKVVSIQLRRGGKSQPEGPLPIEVLLI